MLVSPRVALIGVHGFGRVHLERLIELAAAGRVRIVGLADPRPLDPDVLARVPVPVVADAAVLLDEVRPDVTVISTPIHTHLALARHALAAGSHVLVEKPPTSSLAQFESLVAEATAAGRVCQVGFQSLGSRALEHTRELVAEGALGPLRGIGVHGAWVRGRAYFDRAPWAGRMQLHGAPVTDGALSNAYAHATSAALHIAGASADADADVEVELERWRTMSPEGDDTASARITVNGARIVVAVTLCARASRDPVLVVHGEHGRLELAYTRDTLTGHTADGAPVTAPAGRIDLMDNLLSHLADPDVPLVSPLAASRPFMRVLEAVRLDGPARPLPAAATSLADGGTRTVVNDVDEYVRRCAEELLLFSELPVHWSTA